MTLHENVIAFSPSFFQVRGKGHVKDKFCFQFMFVSCAFFKAFSFYQKYLHVVLQVKQLSSELNISPLTYICTAVDLQTQAPQQSEQQDSESGCMC